MYKISFNERDHVLEMRFSGFWDVEIARRFVADFAAAMTPLRARFGAVPVLSDSRELPVQSHAVQQVLAEFTDRDLAAARARCAIVVKTALSSLQAKRIATTDPLVKVFTDEQEARAWLAQPLAASAA